MRRLQTVTLTLVMAFLASAIGFASAEQSPALVRVPTVLDGVRYEAAAFNALNQDLEGRVTLHYVLLAGESDVQYAFTSLDGVVSFVAGREERRLARTNGGKLARPLDAPAASHGTCAGHQSARTSLFYVDVNCSAAAGFGADAPWTMSNLYDMGFNDSIRSLSCALDSNYTQFCVMYEHAGFTGASLWVEPGDYRDNLALVGDGWADRISSIILYAPQR